MIKRFAAAAVVAAALPLLLTGHATASHFAGHVELIFDAPTPGQDAIVAGNQGIQVTGKSYSTSGGIKKISIAIEAVSPQYALGPAASTSQSWDLVIPCTCTKTISLAWPTASLTPKNGVYRIVSTVETHNLVGTDPSVTRTVENIRVNNGTAAPAGVKAEWSSEDDWFDDSDRIIVSWNRTAEAVDHQKYRVLRSDNGGASYAPVMDANATSFVDTDLGANSAYRYQVIAYRYSPVSGSNPSTASTSATVSTPAVKPPPPPPPSPSPSPSESPTSGTKAGGSPPGLTLQSENRAPGAPPMQSIKPPNIRVGAARAGGFSKLLPFNQSIPKVLAEGAPGQSGSVTSALTAPGRLVGEQLRQNPVRFLAAGALLLVLAGHMARLARSLLLPLAPLPPAAINV